MGLFDRKRDLEALFKGREDELVKKYITQGPSALKKELKLKEYEWKQVFDYLVFNHDLLYKTVTNSPIFFTDMYVKHGIRHVRDVLDVYWSKYDEVCERVFDFLAIERNGLYFHVMEYRDKYYLALTTRGTEFLKILLGILDEKYEESWFKVLDTMLNANVDAMMSEKAFDIALAKFCKIAEDGRKHRAITKYSRV